jgi:hypothetical protein
VKKMMVLIAACAGAAGTLFWLRGGDLGQARDKAKHAMGRAEERMGDMRDEMSSAPAYVPADAPGP